MSANIDVVVIGGGYAGVMAANRLTQRDNVSVTLINPRAGFVERIRLHQAAAGNYDAVTEYQRVLSERVRVVVDTVSRIDAGVRAVELESGGTLGYDYLVYAVGSAGARPNVPGADRFAYPVATLEDARRLRAALALAPAEAPVTVVGAGPTGIETAAELAEQGRRVTLLCGGVLGPYLHARGRRAVARRLAKLGVTVLEGGESRVTEVGRDTVRLGGGHTLSSAVTIWTAGFGVPELARRSGLHTDAAGRLLTDETLTSVDDDRIVAAGDSAAPSELPLRMSCQAAIPLGARAADTVLSRIDGEQPETLNQLLVGQGLSLGREGGLVQLAHRNDVALWFHLDGRLAAKVKEYVCRSTVEYLAGEGAKPGSFGMHKVSGGHQRARLLAARRAEALVAR
ncbi:NAD(P)/FAD-dependent oxidoreductase [Nocardia huaxiensis]|uniref:NAD(P)/FAD-dependent oxidoreductase n=1 Tax=Nocardia huaxiensis TaxID=2755382 RepID=UPI001E46D2CD|nr:FAD-dependent oxidoreductase [Nocardia huaxiensis]UFS94812.1 FAD-dependent oxidoreductase [Nocardia huaxiensis]